jgi:integrase
MAANAEVALWSEEKQKRLQDALVGSWAEDEWKFTLPNGSHRYMHFALLISPSLKNELKYALWQKFDSGAWKREQGHLSHCNLLSLMVQWFNLVAPNCFSLLERSLDQWEISLRTYLTETNQYKPRPRQRLCANQAYGSYQSEDARIALLRQLYRIIADAYDDRPETEKDVWDLRKMGVFLNLSLTESKLNFILISQPWLRGIAKAFFKYLVATQSASTCMGKLGSLRQFSLFLTAEAPSCGISDMNRALVLKYLDFLRAQNKTTSRRNMLVYHLRLFLETCAHRLQLAGVTKERIIFDDDFVKEPEALSREIPEEVLVQLRNNLDALPTITLRMVTILLEVGLRVNEVCCLPLDCLVCDDRHEWYLRFYQSKVSREHIIPLIDQAVVETIQAQQQEVRERYADQCRYLFPKPRFSMLPYKQGTFSMALNTWAVKCDIRDRNGGLWRFQSHQFRHTVGMRLINEDVPLDVISRLLGHRSLEMTRRYAQKRAAQLRAELERVHRKRKTVDAAGLVVKGDSRANDPEVQMTRKGVKGQTLPVGGCGRLVVLGDCSHANKCLTCPMWLTSTDDLSALKSFYDRAIRLKQHAMAKGNQFVIDQQDRIIATLTLRIKSLEATEMDGSLCVDDVLAQLRTDLAEAECGLEEAQAAGLVLATRHLERAMTEMKMRIAALEVPDDRPHE